MLLASLSLCQRELVRFVRQRSRIVGAVGSPLLFWLLIGSGLGRSFRGDGTLQGGYLEYFFPGTLALIVLFTAIFSTISIIEDRHEGFLQGVLVAPVSRLAIVLGKLLAGTTLAVGQAMIVLAIAPLAICGLTAGAVVTVFGVLVVLGLGLTGLGFLIAWQLDSTQGFHAIMNLFLVPLWIMSGALFPASGAAGWIRVLMAVNPLTYGVSALRTAIHGSPVPGDPSLATCLAIVALFTTVLVLVNAWQVTQTRVA
jgi:ABC-2 type transport system permease protein